MDTLLQHGKEKKGLNKGLLLALLVAALLVGGGLFLIWQLAPSMEEQQRQALEGAYREGTPEFDAITRKIVAETDEDNTWASPLGLGTIMMRIAGRIRNNSDRTLTGLEINVAVVDTFGKPIRDKTLLVVPTQEASLEPKEQMNVEVTIDGFTRDDDRARVRWKVTAIKTAN